MKHYLAILFIAAPLHAADFQRDLSPDRPDTTESPFTVEPGRFQVETGIWAFAKDKSDGVKTETWTVGETNFKFGLSQCQDLQLVVRPWIHEQSTDGETREGFGDIELRLKWNLWGNDSGKTAGALLPYVSIPSHTSVSSGEWEGGLIIPVSVEISDKLDLGFQVEAARGWNDDDRDYDWDILHSIVLGIGITEKVGAFIEYVGVGGDSAYEASADAGITWNLTENLQCDFIVAAGLNKAAEDFSISQGITFRF